MSLACKSDRNQPSYVIIVFLFFVRIYRYTALKMNQQRILDSSNRHLMHTYARYPVALIKGRGVKVWSVDGREYLDFLAGIAVNCLGHCHPNVVVAIQKQAQRLLHVSNLYHTVPQTELAEVLVSNSFADRVFFCNSGAEAMEAAIKLARKFSSNTHGSDRFGIVAARNSFHGRTMAALSATGQQKYQEGFEPMLEGFSFVPFNDIGAMEEALGPQVCAVVLEPIQGEGGMNVPDNDYLKQVRELCSNKNILLILDEVQTGIGRTGKLFAHEHSGITPDIMTLAKGLGGGMAIGAVLATSEVAAAFTPGTHASTFGGNPLACAAALATVEHVLEDGIILNNVKRMGAYLLEKLEAIRTKFPWLIRDIRGLGLMTGMEVSTDCPDLVNASLQKGLLIGCAGGNVLRFSPPLIVSEEEIDEMAGIISKVFSGVDAG